MSSVRVLLLVLLFCVPPRYSLAFDDASYGVQMVLGGRPFYQPGATQLEESNPADALHREIHLGRNLALFNGICSGARGFAELESGLTYLLVGHASETHCSGQDPLTVTGSIRLWDTLTFSADTTIKIFGLAEGHIFSDSEHIADARVSVKNELYLNGQQLAVSDRAYGAFDNIDQGAYALADVKAGAPFELMYLMEIDVDSAGTVALFEGFQPPPLGPSRLGMVLPAGVTFTSASGVFLTDLSQQVPEPATLSLFALSLLALLVVARTSGIRRGAPRE